MDNMDNYHIMNNMIVISKFYPKRNKQKLFLGYPKNGLHRKSFNLHDKNCDMERMKGRGARNEQTNEQDKRYLSFN